MELNKDIRIKRTENYNVLSTIKTQIANELYKKYMDQTKGLRDENDMFDSEECEFFKSVTKFFKTVTITTQLKIVTQVGPNSSILNTYVGTLQYLPGESHLFNFCCSTKFEGKPLSVGFSCLQSIEII